MLSYRHAFHAGNPADVLKHLVLCEALALLTAKDKPLWYIDTHAGAGLYTPGTGIAAGHAEHAEGIARLWNETSLPPPLERYLALVRAANPDGALRRYPGSPWLASRLLRPGDRLWLHELHPADSGALARLFEDDGSRTRVIAGDGLAGLRALLPPRPRRALVMIDPSWEVKEDYRSVPAALRDALRRFATGVYLLWYPLLDRHEPQALARQLRAIDTTPWLQASLCVRGPRDPQGGMYGSAVFVLNPPWRLREALEQCAQALSRCLAGGHTGALVVEVGGRG
jgi:23S rRNA (adenine2030-N6)-methyltransferase